MTKREVGEALFNLGAMSTSARDGANLAGKEEGAVVRKKWLVECANIMDDIAGQLVTLLGEETVRARDDHAA